MTLEDFNNLLKTTGLPVTYLAWPEQKAPPLPFICYMEVGTNNFFADGKVYFSARKIRIELYTQKKQPNTEAILEDILSDFTWEKAETYIKEEKMYKIEYELEV